MIDQPGAGGEDDGSTEIEGDDRRLHADQKSSNTHGAEDDDRTKTQDLAKAGRTDFDPNEGQK